MKTKIKFNGTYFILFIIIFIIEIYIALFVKDMFIRPFVGDILVIMLIYYFIRMLIEIDRFKVVFWVLLFAFSVEVGQYYNLINILKLQHNAIARIIIGTTFSTSDLLAYIIGAFLIIIPDIIFFLYYRKQKH